MRWEEIFTNYWSLKLGYGEWRISRYTFKLRNKNDNNSYYECEPYYVGYDYSSNCSLRGKRITGECLTFNMCVAAIERHIMEENNKQFP